MRVLLYDRVGGGRAQLSTVWAAGARLYQRRGRVDLARGVASWDEALALLAAVTAPITELQLWGHGTWGAALIDGEPLDASALAPASRRRGAMEAVRDALAPGALLWFRTCETLGAARGHDFARRLADFTGARVAGHTYVIAYHQSGLHGVAPGVAPDWAADEGLARGSAAAPEAARWSTPWAPRTITCLDGAVPAAWFAPARAR